MDNLVLRRFGEPEELRVEQWPEPVPTDGQSLIDVSLAGINFDDLCTRRGDYEQTLPLVLGIDIVGSRRRDARRVAALMRGGGGYAQVAAAADAYTVELPQHISDEQAVGLLEQGATAYGALVLAGRLRAGESVAITAAAGGVGHLALQLAVAYGASPVIGIVGSSTKYEFVANLGADNVINSGVSELEKALRNVTGGRGVDLIIDGNGGSSTSAALRGLAPFGRLVCYGFRPVGLERGSICITTEELINRSVGCAGFWMEHVVDNSELLRRIAKDLFDLSKSGQLVAHIDRVVSLSNVPEAHAAMASRTTLGKVLIDVNRR